jgi:hypothetical protein
MGNPSSNNGRTPATLIDVFRGFSQIFPSKKWLRTYTRYIFVSEVGGFSSSYDRKYETIGVRSGQIALSKR